MSNELRIAGPSGLTYTCEVRGVDGTLIGSAASLTYSNRAYRGDMPAEAVANTEYDLFFVEAGGAVTAVSVFWNGTTVLNLGDAVTADVATALTNIHLDHLFAADYDPASKPGVATALLNELIGDDSGVSQFTSNALENAPTGGGGGATASEIADAVWDEAKADHNTSGTFGESLNNAGSGSSASDIADAIIAQTSTIAITSPFNPVTKSLDIIIGETLDFTITRAFSASWSYIEFVIKDRIGTPVGDDDAILKAIVYADGSDGGLIVLNKAPVVAGNTNVVITADQPNNTTRIKVLDSITYQLTKAAKLYFTVRWVDSSSDSQSVSGQAQAGHVAAEGGDA